MKRLFKKLENSKAGGRKRLLVLAAALILLALLAAVVYWAVIRDRAAPESEAITYSTDEPSEDQPDNNYVWRGWPEEPKRIIIPSIDVNGFIQKVGIDQNQQIAVPNNIHIAGWFVNSVRPGEQGLSIIDGHVDGRFSSNGIFKRLGELKTGDEYQVELGSGKLLQYRVLEVATVTTDQAAGVLFSQNSGVSSQLNLITCTGSWNSDAREYDQRIIVTSELIDED